MPVWKVVHAGDVGFEERDGDVSSGLGVAVLCGPSDGTVHLEVALSRLAPGGSVRSHVHPFEESFFVLEGDGVFAVADQLSEMGAGGYGFAPVATPHRWSNPSDRDLVWVRTRSPQPRRIGDADGVHPVPDPIPADATPRPLDVADRTRRFVGRYQPDMMPTPGPIQMKGFRSSAARNVAVWMLVDEVLGAVHHTKFCVRFDPTGQSMTLGGQHFHPFEETYYITDGRAVAHLEDQSIEVGPGDLVFAGVNALHGFSNLGTEPVRWIEMQAPNPPISNAFFFKTDWQDH